MHRHLVIFDLDETLVHATKSILDRPSDLRFEDYFVYVRPHVNECLLSISKVCDIAVWSSASKKYVEEISSIIFGEVFPTKFIWSVERCVQKVDLRSNGYVYIKDLRKVQKYGYTLETITMVDDSPEKLVRQPKNHLHIEPFTGKVSDIELLALPQRVLERAAKY